MRHILLLATAASLMACTPPAAKVEPPPPPPSAEALAAQALGLAADAKLTPESVAALLDAHGPGTVVRGLSNTGDTGAGGLWTQVVDGVSSGADAWLALAPRLNTEVDAATAETLNLAMQAALAKNAPGVLKLIGEAFPEGDVCTVGLIEPTPEQVKAAKDAATTAVKAVKDPALKTVKAACLAELAKVK